MPMFAQTTGSLQTKSATPAAIPGLTFVLPEGKGPVAIIILNIPNPYAQGNNYPGGIFSIAVNGTVLPPIARATPHVGPDAAHNTHTANRRPGGAGCRVTGQRKKKGVGGGGEPREPRPGGDDGGGGGGGGCYRSFPSGENR